MNYEHENRSSAPLAAASAEQRRDDTAGVDTRETAPAVEIPELTLADSVPDDEAGMEPALTLSPSVRRLVRQYDLDITGIHGTGPAGRIKVGDVIALLGGRGEPAQNRPADPERTIPAADDPTEERPRHTPYRSAPLVESAAAAIAPGTAAGFPATTVFECDASRVLAHRKQCRQQNGALALTSYYLVACGEALRLVPEAAPAGTELGVVMSAADGQVRTVLVDVGEDSALSSMNDRLVELDRALRARDAPQDLRRAALLLHHHGLAGSLIATPTPIANNHAASLGIGRVRRQVVVRTIDGEETPRIAALCYLSLSFLTDHLDLPRANRFLAHVVRVLEQWPD
jgi:pyruvate/2-oxoglutarate dehydrogenase complex dihydrolipoamide acyltransferase (E2) component